MILAFAAAVAAAATLGVATLVSRAIGKGA